MKSELHRYDRRRARQDRRERVSGLPAHVGAPLLLSVLAIAGTGLFAVALGLPSAGVVAAVVVVTVLAAVLAHRTVSSLAVGAGVLLAQPYRAGDQVRTYVPSLRRTVEAEVVRVGAANTTLLVRDVDVPESGDSRLDSLVVVPNNQMLRAS